MPVRALLAGAALVGAVVTLCGCGSDPETTKAPATPAPTPAPTPATTKAPTPAPLGMVQKAWNNHLAAFASGANQEGTASLDKIMLDYDADSTIAVFNDHCDGNKVNNPNGSAVTRRDGYTEYKTTEEIRQFFADLFKQLGSLDNVNTIGPLVEQESPVVKEGDRPEGNVFLTWRTNLTGEDEIKYATDSFSWQIKDGAAKIWKQNIVTTEPQKDCANVPIVKAACETAKPKPSMCAGWDNHLEAFSKGTDPNNTAALDQAALDQIMQDYTDDSLVQVFDNRVEPKKGYTAFKGLAKIQGMFKQLFADIVAAKNADGTGLGVKLLEVEPKFSGVFLVWESLSHPKATDTFVFNDEGKIIRQNIVVETKKATDVKVVV